MSPKISAIDSFPLSPLRDINIQNGILAGGWADQISGRMVAFACKTIEGECNIVINISINLGNSPGAHPSGIPPKGNMLSLNV